VAHLGYVDLLGICAVPWHFYFMRLLFLNQSFSIAFSAFFFDEQAVAFTSFTSSFSFEKWIFFNACALARVALFLVLERSCRSGA
jgi:hypothetical protein